jgi:hypothetical protein
MVGTMTFNPPVFGLVRLVGPHGTGTNTVMLLTPRQLLKGPYTNSITYP